MHRDAARYVLVAFTLVGVFASLQSEANAGRLFGRRRQTTAARLSPAVSAVRQPSAVRPASLDSVSCICIQYMFADMGYTQLYYALEHPSCQLEQCPYSTPVWQSGYNLPTNQNCPDCWDGSRLAALKREEPKLTAAKPLAFDFRRGDDELSLNPSLSLTYDPTGFGRPRMGTILHPDDGRPMNVKVFAMKVNEGRAPVILFGVEVDKVSKPDFSNVQAKRVGDMKYVYRFEIDGVWQDCVVVATR